MFGVAMGNAHLKAADAFAELNYNIVENKWIKAV